jgi:hypothetical protein
MILLLLLLLLQLRICLTLLLLLLLRRTLLLPLPRPALLLPKEDSSTRGAEQRCCAHACAGLHLLPHRDL